MKSYFLLNSLYETSRDQTFFSVLTFTWTENMGSGSDYGPKQTDDSKYMDLGRGVQDSTGRNR